MRERPTSARPAPPRIKKRDDDSTEDIAVRFVQNIQTITHMMIDVGANTTTTIDHSPLQ